ncbi:MAG: NusG domain II-containing protein [Actinomycetota bacterium]|nr:NusG domain II-containing protein [Actinomycetota bacterium]
MTHADRILIIAIAVLALLVGPATMVASGYASASSAYIEGPSGETVVPLGSDRVLEVAGLRGSVVVEVVDGSVSVRDAVCPDELCVQMGPVSHAGAAIVCVPNAVTVRVGGVRSGGLDAVAR